MSKLLKIRDLSIGFGKMAPTIQHVNFSVEAGETVALVGESGSGKTLTCNAILRILPSSAQIRSGQILFDCDGNEVDLTRLPKSELRKIRGNKISMIFQEPMRSFSPLHKIGDQVCEVLTLHTDMSAKQAQNIVLEKFERVGFPNPERTLNSYPFELSGGMRQRAMIAMAISAKPKVLIADEPTTALDVTTQAQTLHLIKEIQQETGMAVVLVTHDLGVVANMADKMVVMRKGKVMESGPTNLIIDQPAHPYTKNLMAAAPVIPDNTHIEPAPQEDIALELNSVHKVYKVRSSGWMKPKLKIPALQGVSLRVRRGKTLAVVGESGSGKSTCARIALGCEQPNSGTINYYPSSKCEPINLAHMDDETRFTFLKKAQMVFQDPFASLSPRMKIIDILTEPLEIHEIGTRAERREKAVSLIEQVGLDPNMATRYPHAFSGGQRQRLSIARALALDPEILVCDEPTSALDVSVQAQVLDLLEDIRDRMNLSYMFISHDLAVVARIADDVAVMRRGRVVEQAPPHTLFAEPKHPYTKALIAARPEPDIHRLIDFDLVSQGAGEPETWPEAFRFDGDNAPKLQEISPGHLVRTLV